MATMPMPNLMINPTGVTGSGNFNGAGLFSTSSGFQTPATGGPGTMNFGNTMNPMPQTSGVSGGTATPAAVSQNPGGTSSGRSTNDPFTGTVTSEGATTASANPFGLSQGQANWMEKYLQETYGGGMGALIYQYLQSNGGYNSAITGQTVGATTNAMQNQTQAGANSLISSLGSMGVSGASSEMGGALQSYENTATATQNQITAQDYYNMWAESQQNELNMMQFAATGTAKTLANKANWLDWITGGTSLAGAVSGSGKYGSSGSSGGSSSGGSSNGMNPQEMAMLMAAGA
jgi:hypothetical protein